ncbi:hypothetical protein CEXT_584831 [Caerostris extrusa]|uniref:Uncharacterized protein n=1 Tax=Caerostris extrusa TaxID=172846 RepID=A0AAV4T4Z0_CAEEX|nr:hypothetical protein CEXT_584831 [Caerostris extrusa]
MEQLTRYSSYCKEGNAFELEKLGEGDIQENWMISLKSHSVGKSFQKEELLMAPGWLIMKQEWGQSVEWFGTLFFPTASDRSLNMLGADPPFRVLCRISVNHRGQRLC